MNSVYDTGDQLWLDLCRKLVMNARPVDSRNGPCYEVIGYSALLTNPYEAWIKNDVRKASATYGAAELLWYLSGTDRVEMLECYAPSYRKFIGGHGYAKGAYGARIAQYNQLASIYNILKRDPESRQAVMTMYWPEDQLRVAMKHDLDDVPCTLSLQFLIRHGALFLVATMRSNDAWRGLPYDMWCFTRLQIMLAGALGVKVGPYVHNVGSMHIYEKEALKFAQAFTDLNRVGSVYEPYEVFFRESSLVIPTIRRLDSVVGWKDYVSMVAHIQRALNVEKTARLQSGQSVSIQHVTDVTLLDECAALCAVHCGAERPSWLTEGLK